MNNNINNESINLSEIAKNENYDVEIKNEVSIKPARNSGERNQEFITRIFAWIIVAGVTYWCLNTLSSSKSSTQAQEVAQTTFSGLIGGVVGYVIGKREK